VPTTLTAALAARGITSPRPIQARTVPDALAGRDVLGRAETGSGKTLAFGLPLLVRTATGSGRRQARRPRGLVLVPTRELADQVHDELVPLAAILGVRLLAVYGGVSLGRQVERLRRGVDIIVATPGRLLDLLGQGACSLDAVAVAVVDEADHMADMGFLPAVTSLLDRVPPGGQRLLFSATLDGAVNRVVKRYLSDPVTHEVDSAQASVGSMEHHVLLVRPSDKATVTAEIAGRDGRTVIFVRTQLGANRVAEQLREAGVLAGALHGGLTQGARARMLGAFKDGRLPVLVATDVAARGIHVDEIGLVLQVDPPAGPKDYLHRAGRTARAGETGVVVTLALPHQRREVERLTRQAGVQTVPLNAEPGDTLVVAATGSRVPSGPAVSQQEFEKLVAPPARSAKRHPGQGNRSRGNFRGGSAGRRPRY
jgi:superfamily II DNA/RNA helicase